MAQDFLRTLANSRLVSHSLLPMAEESTVEEREAAYWNEVAAKLTDDDLLQDAVGVTEDTVRRMEMLGSLAGKRVLDVGCGTGAWSVHLAEAGAEVWAIDISPGSIAMVERRARLKGVSDRIHAAVMSATELEFPDSHFDAVHGMNIIHHLDVDAFGAEIARVLRPEGVAVFSENNANSKLLMWARDNLCGRFGIPKWSSDDEYPLTSERRERFALPFSERRFEYPEFRFFHYFNAKFFKYRSKLVSAVCNGLDRGMCRAFPGVRQYSYRQLVYVAKPLAKGSGKSPVPPA